MYKPICQQKEITIGTGYPIIVTCWTPVESFLKQYEGDYGAVGNLYSPFGLTYLIRNLLANPNYQLVLFYCKNNQVNADVKKAIESFVYDEKIPEGLSDIPLDALRKGLSSINFFICETLEDVYREREIEARIKIQDLTVEPLIYPPSQIDPEETQGIYNGLLVKGSTVRETWLQLCDRIIKTGKKENGRVELINAFQVIENVTARDLDFFECSYEELEQYTQTVLTLVSHEDSSYTYGDRIRNFGGTENYGGVDQLEKVVNRLRFSRENTQSVISLWNPATDYSKPQFPPCLNQIWFRIHDNKLYLTSVWRSHDIGKAYFKNISAIRGLQLDVLVKLNVNSKEHISLGPLAVLSESAHIYLEDYEEVKRKIKEDSNFFTFILDQAGSFLVEVNDGKIAVTWTDKSGFPIKEFEGANAQEIRKKIARYVALETSHALYLGQELYKAELAIKADAPYQQK